ncbi:hypothetical protein COV18_01915 [Candidatus Woesearchaeota archaeon CG10_big_fil_rev_8_21_14_0_10_37_12]|nr:MAG: hypothetical protein COV18_01915 [Candidatus Woesearchaeota archaeon CG10_big_fil_rev_8_21_14_0_10_37_12]
MDYREKILALVRTKPVLPNDVAKELKTNTTMAGAMLSELCSNGLLKVSTVKIGGSPLYYLPENKHQLLNYLNNLNKEDKQTAERLQHEQIIREQDEQPLTRVSLRQIKDFAEQLIVAYEGKEETFWKWYALTDKEAEEKIKQILESKSKESRAESGGKQISPGLQASLKSKESEVNSLQLELEHLKPETGKETDKDTTQETKEKPKKEPKPKNVQTKQEDFWQTIEQFLQDNKIQLIEKNMTKRNTEYDLLIELPSPMGTLTYYCKARHKKSISPEDLSSAYVQGQLKKIPVIYLTTGKLTKKAEQHTRQLSGFTVKQL